MIGAALKLLPAMARGRANPGRCATCEALTLFVQEGGWLRDHYVCARCRSIPRWRALTLVIDAEIPGWRSLRVHEAAPGGAASDRLREAPGYTYSYFDVEGEPREDLEALSLPDGSIDLFITQDVFEHVLQPEVAFAEIARVLRPGGAHVFTVPIYDRPATVVRVGAGGQQLLEPDYHAGPEGASLVVREWGRDLPDFVDAAAPFRTSVHLQRSRWRGLDGEHLEVLVSRRI